MRPLDVRACESFGDYTDAIWACQFAQVLDSTFLRRADRVWTTHRLQLRVSLRLFPIAASMIRTRGAHCLMVLALIAMSDPAWALRCGNRLVKEGMHEAQVIELCGEPSSVRQLGFVLRPYIVRRPAGKFGHRATRYTYGGYHQELLVTEMLYNFGPHRLMRIIRFEGGRVSNIETAGYGYREKKR